MKNRFFVFVIILFAVVFGGWIYALDTIEGNYLNFKISTKFHAHATAKIITTTFGQ